MCKSSRMLSLILALVFVVACFAGCGGIVVFRCGQHVCRIVCGR